MALQYAAPGVPWATTVVALGSVVAHTAVLLVFQLGQPRIFFSMARDGLLPPVFASVHPRFKTPHVTTIVTGVVVALFAGVASIDEMVDLTNIGTLFAFVLVCAGIPVLRSRQPDRTRPFRVPFGPWLVPVAGMASCVFLALYLPPASWWRFFGWLALGLAVYAGYGYRHSVLARGADGALPRSVPALRIATVGFLIAALGQFLMPHGVRVHRLAAALADSAHPDHDRALVGLLVTLVGVVAGVVGLRAGVRQTR
jgi:APA family basic amino acid/polyamine antiporter